MEISVVVMVITIVSDSAVELVLFSPTMSISGDNLIKKLTLQTEI